jgi:hypothetical protein
MTDKYPISRVKNNQRNFFGKQINRRALIEAQPKNKYPQGLFDII